MEGANDDRRDDREPIDERTVADAGGQITLLGHFYRGQLDRETTWRNRLDRTTDWAVIVIATVLTWAFTSRENPHYVLLIGVVLLVVFLAIDTRRYRAYDVWRSRIRMLEQDLFAQVFDPEPGAEHGGWQRLMSEDLRRPAVKVGPREAVARRLRRVYLPLVTILLLGWLFHVSVFQPDEPWLVTASVVDVPGAVVVAAVGAVYAALVVLAAWPVRREAGREFYEERPDGWPTDDRDGDETGGGE